MVSRSDIDVMIAESALQLSEQIKGLDKKMDKQETFYKDALSRLSTDISYMSRPIHVQDAHFEQTQKILSEITAQLSSLKDNRPAVESKLRPDESGKLFAPGSSYRIDTRGMVDMVGAGHLASVVRDNQKGLTMMDRDQINGKLTHLSGWISAVDEKLERHLANGKHGMSAIYEPKEALRRGTDIGKPSPQNECNVINEEVRKYPEDTRTIAGIRYVSRWIDGVPGNEIKGVIYGIRDRIGSGVIAIMTADSESGSLFVSVSTDLTEEFHADEIVRQTVLQYGGKGTRDIVGGDSGMATFFSPRAVIFDGILSTVELCFLRILASHVTKTDDK